MLSIVIFAIGVMYTPGPVNILSFSSGLQRGFRVHAPFSLGVGLALFVYFLLVGHAGSTVVSDGVLPVVGALGAGFICYLAFKIMTSEVALGREADAQGVVDFKDGLLMQLLNPKSFLVVLPVAAVQFPAAGITGWEIALWSFFMGALGFGAPFGYAAMGAVIGRRVKSAAFFRAFNVLMGLMLVAVAMDMAYRHVFLALAA
jgi:threonine/homoserine/homoserine lactone efflux protein